MPLVSLVPELQNLPIKWGQLFCFALQFVIHNSAIYLLELALEV